MNLTDENIKEEKTFWNHIVKYYNCCNELAIFYSKRIKYLGGEQV